MPTSVALGPRYESFVKQQLASGRYNNASEVVRAGLRLLENYEEAQALQLEDLRQAIQAGLDSGVAGPIDEVFERLDAKYRAMLPADTDAR